MLNESSAVSATKSYRFEFRGDGFAYLKIWVVNIILTALTLGVYSAWAKVRTRRYFYQNTRLNERSFDFHAEPFRILLGRIIVMIGLLALLAVREIRFSILIPICLTVLAPYFLVRGAIFTMSNTSYDGIRFGFIKSYRDAYITFINMILITIVSFGLGAIFYGFYYRRYLLDNSLWGSLRFSLEARKRQFLKVFIGPALIFFFYLCISYAVLVLENGGNGESNHLSVLMNLVSIVLYGALIVAYRSAAWNFYAKHLKLGNIRFIGRQSFIYSSLLYATGIILTVITLGLAWPWVKIAFWRYKISTLEVLASEDDFNAGKTTKAPQEDSLVGESAASFWDLDIGF